jgi:2-succinyl-5-enolpyruvyl-6-hydroxy-3-cyclohexene-1-carboxylate synthase
VSVPTGRSGEDPAHPWHPARAERGSVQATFAATMVDEWVRGGVTAAVVSPGSRSTPLTLALADRSELALHVRLDERSAGFFAVGLAAASGRPVVVCTTSGTAAAELHPAVVEAHHARVPLLVCTADRPPELHEVGAPQTIDQHGLYGQAVRWAADPGVAEAVAATTWRALARRALAESWAGPVGPGPVHLNLPFRDPLVARPGPLPPVLPPAGVPSAGSGESPAGPGAARPPAPSSVEALISLAVRRGVVVAGEGAGPPAAVTRLARALGWPLLADPRSGCRIADPVVVSAADAFLREPEVGVALRPEVVLLLGSPWASKVLASWLHDGACHGAEVLAVDPWWRWVDPDRIVARTIREEPGPLLEAAVRSLASAAHRPAPGWLDRWQAVEAAAQSAIDAELATGAGRGDGGLSEPMVGRMLLGALPAATRVVASSSMPVRELEWFAPPLAEPPPVHANRGANGIDGVCSTALGVAAAGRPVVALIGDLAFLHDASALVRPRPTAPGTGASGMAEGMAGAQGAVPVGSCTLVVLDNQGGAIFSFLPQASALAPERFEALFGTPQAPDVVAVARGFGVPTEDVATVDELRSALKRLVGQVPLSVVRARLPDRRQNVLLHARLMAAAASAARRALR